jgi:hypothetical protein
MDGDMLAHAEAEYAERHINGGFVDSQGRETDPAEEKDFLRAQADYAARRRPQYGQQRNAVPVRTHDAGFTAKANAFATNNTDVFQWLGRGVADNDSFAISLLRYYSRNGYLTVNQIAAVRKQLTKAIAPTAAPPTGAAALTSNVDLRNVPSGWYAIPGGDTRLKVKIDNITEGKWAGWIFVNDGAEYGHGRKYGSQKPGQPTYSGAIVTELRAITADPKAASAAYGHLVGRCGVCNRKLEDETSVARGIGPVCFAKFS